MSEYIEEFSSKCSCGGDWEEIPNTMRRDSNPPIYSVRCISCGAESAARLQLTNIITLEGVRYKLFYNSIQKAPTRVWIEREAGIFGKMTNQEIFTYTGSVMRICCATSIMDIDLDKAQKEIEDHISKGGHIGHNTGF